MFGVFLKCVFLLHGFSGVDSEKVSVMEGDSVTLHTGIKTNQDRIHWYFYTDRIAWISEDQSKICADVECPERFRDRLKLDNVTGSLIITNITNTDSGEYQLKIINTGSDSDKIFSVSVHDAPVADREEIKTVKEGESVTLDPGVMNNTNYLITFLFNDVLIAEISEDQSKTCTDVQCEDSDERFRDRLKLDHQTGSLTITNTRTTDSGEYKLQIIIISSSSFSIRRSRSFSVTVSGSGPSLVVVAGICAAVVILLVTAAAGVMYLKQKKGRGAEPNQAQENHIKNSSVSKTEAAANGASCEKNETATEIPP